MDTTNKRWTQLSVFAAAALLILAAAAVMMVAGGNPAQATTETIAPASGGGHLPPLATGTTPTPTPRFPEPEPCPGDESRPNDVAAPAVDSGHIALFDVWWNTEELELTNTSCPPTVVHVPESEVDGETTPAKDIRSPSNINIDETVIHIPNSAEVTLNERDYPKDQYRDLWNADGEENPDGDGDGIVWALPACPPEGSPPANGLCLSFSAALLNRADWTGDIVYHVDHVHQIDIDRQDPRYVLVYEGISGGNALRWDSSDARRSQMPVAPGGYDRPMWFFTSRGTYEFQVHITGNPNSDQEEPVSPNDSVDGDVREYVIHVGAEADLGVGVSVEPEPADGDTTLDPGDNVTITVIASNAGPDMAQDTKVDVSLPSGLVPPVGGQPYPSQATKGTYADGVWTIGSMCNPTEPVAGDEPECPQEATLTITAKVAAGTHGEKLAVKAKISATETVVEEFEVPVLDPNPSNNIATGMIMVANRLNVNPMFAVMRSVNENAPGETNVGDPIKVIDPDDSAGLDFSLDEAGKKHFTVSNAGGNAQIKVKPNVYLNYEETSTFQFTLHVSDKKTASGNIDGENDDSIPVIVSLTDVAETGGFVKTLFSDPWPPVVGNHLQLCMTPENYPGSRDLSFTYLWQARAPGGEVDWTRSLGSSNCITFTEAEAGTVEYRGIGLTPPNGNPRNAAETSWTSVTWSSPQE